nr:MATH domain-containing protein At5g43560-like isoform X1 [Ipomoea batatas]GMD75818.1 MATH domain-containing protein At5g43560-like isoform X1 [Ipomoea batatas]
MAAVMNETAGVGRSLEGVSSAQQLYQSGEALAEWRSSEQVENGIPSTSPPYWDSDDEEDNGGSKPSELYGKYTWKIDKFSQINKRELRSNAFEVGSYKWYILIYPQGCDVCNHLSLFLCVANHDKLLPGWSHFAQFTIAVVNKDPKKSKYSDTLHRFWKKEHDWGWKKFMELSKVLDGFIDADTLIIKAQVQVIRERADRPFRCLDRHYRRELVRVYLTNVEQICRRFVEERRSKLGKLIEDKARWSGFCAFWLGMDQSSRRRMSKEKMDAILKVVVKHFFVEKEVTSTLVMDSLYSGLRALEGQYKGKKGKGKYIDSEEQPAPIVRMEKDMFILVDDVLLLLERASLEPLPPKDEKGPQNRTKDGASGEDFNKDSIERDERRLTELGRRTIEIFVLAHIFSKIEIAYQEAVALKRQEELIREEEAAWMAETELKTKRGASEKEKKSKKKQGKQKRNNRKVKDKLRDEKPGVLWQDKPEEEPLNGEGKDYFTEERESIPEKPDILEEVSDISDSVDCVPEVLNRESEDRDVSPVNWDTDTLENPPVESSCSELSGFASAQNGVAGRRSLSAMDDSSSTCSTDSAPSVMNGHYGGNASDHKNQISPGREKNHRAKSACNTARANEMRSRQLDSVSNVAILSDTSGSCKAIPESQATSLSSSEQHVVKKEKVISQERKLDRTDVEGPSMNKTSVLSPPRSPPKEVVSTLQSKSKILPSTVSVTAKNPSPDIPKLTDKLAKSAIHPESVVVKTDSNRSLDAQVIKKSSSTQQVPIAADGPSAHQVPTTSDLSCSQMPATTRSLSAPIVTVPRPTAPVVSNVQTSLHLTRSVSATGRLGPEPSPATHSYLPQSYRNAMMGAPVTGSLGGFSQPHSPSSTNSSHSYSEPPAMISRPVFLPQGPKRTEPSSIRPSFSYEMVNHDLLQNGSQWMECSQRDGRSATHDGPSVIDSIRNFDMYKPSNSQTHDLSAQSLAGTSGRPSQSVLADEFPHLDIINDLLDDDLGIGMASGLDPSFQSFNNGPHHHLARHFTFPGDVGSADLGPSTSSCRLERTLSYHDNGFLHRYPGGGHFDTGRDMITQQPSPQSFVNGQMDGIIPSQWQMVASDASYLGMRSAADSDVGYPYHVPDYSNMASGFNGYTMFRPSNGL